MRTRAHIFVSGRVQGVGFRMYEVDKAEDLSLAGWVRNLDDGRVEIVAEGEEADVEAFADWCKSGPESAGVSHSRVSYSEANDEYDGFNIRYTNA